MKIGANLVKVLRDTLRKLEEDPEFGPEHPGVSEFRRILLLRIAELEPPIVPPDPIPEAPAPAFETPALPEEPVLDPALDPAQNPAVKISELTSLVADAASELPIPLPVATDPGEIN
jgi:hypothetical protein